MKRIFKLYSNERKNKIISLLSLIFVKLSMCNDYSRHAKDLCNNNEVRNKKNGKEHLIQANM